MYSVIGVRFKRAGKIYYFDPNNLDVVQDQYVIVETARGVEYGKVVIGRKEVDDADVVLPLKKVIRVAGEADARIVEENRAAAKEAFGTCAAKIKEHKLGMKLIDVEYTFDRNKIIFYFTADGRVDFRELVKDLASVFRTRIELRQIGVRDEAKILEASDPAAGRCVAQHGSAISSRYRSRWRRTRICRLTLRRSPAFAAVSCVV